MRFDWDATKAAANLKKHGVSFEAGAVVFDDPNRLEEEDVFARGEYRTLVIGRVDGITLAVVYTEPEEGVIRLISARVASAQERKVYEHGLFHS